MDSFYIGYRDPLFGIIVFFLLVFIISFVSYWWSVYKERDEEKSIRKFIKKFQIQNGDDEYKIIFEDKNLTLDTIILLAKSYEKIGEYEKSIGIYLYALTIYKKRIQKQNILFLLGKVYLRVGFLERAREIFIKALKISPRHKDSLKYLTITYELLKEYSKAEEALDALEELGVDVKMDKIYIKAMRISREDIPNDKKEKELSKLTHLRSTQRIYVEFVMKNSMRLDFKKIEEFDMKNLFDILWRLDDLTYAKEVAENKPFLKDIMSAKGVIEQEKECEIFELEVIKNLNKTGYKKADLSFEYFCNHCKNSYPFYFSRCPSCHTIDSCDVVPQLVRKDVSDRELMVG